MLCIHLEAEALSRLRALEVNPDTVHQLSCAIVTEVLHTLDESGTEEYFNEMLADGHAILETLWNTVKGEQIAKELICMPISYAEIATMLDVDQLEDGKVLIDEAGMAVFERMIGGVSGNG